MNIYMIFDKIAKKMVHCVQTTEAAFRRGLKDWPKEMGVEDFFVYVICHDDDGQVFLEDFELTAFVAEVKVEEDRHE